MDANEVAKLVAAQLEALKAKGLEVRGFFATRPDDDCGACGWIDVTIDREEARANLKLVLGADYVWFFDEAGTIYDPYNGPYLVKSDRARTFKLN